MGLTVSLRFNDLHASTPTQLDLRVCAWLTQQIGTRGERWGAHYNYAGWCWDVTFVNPAHATLFKLTWA